MYIKGAVQGHTLTINEIPSHTHTRGSMNITGSLVTHSGASKSLFHQANGAFSHTTQCADDGIRYNESSSGNWWCDKPHVDFAASRTWTGETSAVGGGASHTHGIKMTDGKYLKTGGGTGGSNTSTVSVKGAVQGHTLTIKEIPSHTHTFTGTSVTTSENGAHTHTRGTMEIYGRLYSWSNDNNNVYYAAGGAFYLEKEVNNSLQIGINVQKATSSVVKPTFLASRDWTGATSSNGNHTHTVTAKGTNSNTGGGASHTHGIKMVIKKEK